MSNGFTFSGSALVISWIYSGGTVTLTGDQRSATITPTSTQRETTAGSDGSIKRVGERIDVSVSIALLMQNSAAGRTLETALAENGDGTLLIYPAGTVSGQRLYTIPCISSGPQVNSPYADNTELSNAFVGNGVVVATWRGTA